MAQTIGAGALTQDTITALLAGPPVLHNLSTQTIVFPSVAGRRLLTFDGVLALTLNKAPVAGEDDLKLIQIISTVSRAHTLTTSNLLQTGSANVAIATFAAQPGAGLTLMCWNGKLIVLYSVGITFS